MTSQRVALIFGGSGTIGAGVIKALLENPKAPWIVTVARNAEKLSSMKQKFGNLPEDKLLIVEGNVATEENAAKLKENILAKTGCITDVVSCMGAWWQKGPVLDQPLSEFRECCDNILTCHFLAAKTFLPLIGDKEGSSYTFITGNGGNMYFPNASMVCIFGASLMQLINFVQHEWENKPVRINQVSIVVRVTEPSGEGMNHMIPGRGIAGVMMNSTADGKRFACFTEEDFNKLAQSGTH